MRSEEIYDSSQNLPVAIQEVKEAFRHHFLIGQFIRRDILTRYKRSYLGIGWSMLNPLGTMVVMTIVFSHLFGSVPGYPVYVLSGIIAWNFYSKSTTAAMNTVVWGGGLIRRIYLPKTSFSISAIGTEIVNLGFSLVPLALVMLVTGVHFGLSITFLPICILLLSCFSLGVALLLTTVAIYFPDVAEMYQIILTAWMYLTPIIYPETAFPTKYRFMLEINPLTSLVRMFHVTLFEGRFPLWVEIWPAILWSFGVLIFSWLFFTKKSDEFVYRV